MIDFRNRKLEPTNSFSDFKFRAKASENINYNDENNILKILSYIYYY